MVLSGRERACVIVDAFSAGSYLAPAFRNCGIVTHHVQSAEQIPSCFLRSYRAEDFTTSRTWCGDFDRLLDDVRRLHPAFVLAGAETGVTLADRLSDALKLFPNDPETRKARRHKYLMIEALRAAGMNASVQFQTSNVLEALAWVRKTCLTRFVVKPPESMATDGVTVCSGEKELSSAIEAILGRADLAGNINRTVVVQEYLEGQEYIVNSVSWDGEARVSGVWRVDKKRTPDGHMVYDCVAVVSHEKVEWNLMREYTERVLAVLGIRFGPAHSEVMLTSKGPILIETNARMDGSNVFMNEPKIRCLENDQLELTVEAYVHPAGFLRLLKQGPNRVLRPAMWVSLIAPRSGLLMDLPRLRDVKSLQSFWDLHLRVAPGESIKRTVDLFSSPGAVWLSHPDPKTIERDRAAIRAMEAADFYLLKSPTQRVDGV